MESYVGSSIESSKCQNSSMKASKRLSKVIIREIMKDCESF